MASHKFVKGQEGFVAIIGDEDTVTGFLLAGIGDNDPKNGPNYLIVTQKTELKDIEETFRRFTARKDVAMVLINQHIADEIRFLLQEYTQIIPTILEIPSKEAPYDPSNDMIMKRIKIFFGTD